MAKEYFIVNRNNQSSNQNGYDVVNVFLILICLISVVLLICNYFFNYGLSSTTLGTIVVLLILLIICKNIFDTDE